MKMKIYALRLTVALATFGLTIGLLNVGRYLKSVWRTKPVQFAAVQPSIEKESANFRVVVQNTAVETAKNEVESSENTYEFDGEGEYYIPGEPPKGFKEFGAIQIETRDWEESSDEFPYGKPFPPKGYIFHNEKFIFKRISIANRLIALETQSVKGISYKFVGTFLKETVYDENLKASIMLEGHLTKLKNGKKAAKADVRLAVNEPCGC